MNLVTELKRNGREVLKKILQAQVPKAMEKKALNELEHYGATPSNSAESELPELILILW